MPHLHGLQTASVQLACRTLHDLALAHDVDLPLARTVRAIVWEGYDAVAAAQDLLDRPQKPVFVPSARLQLGRRPDFRNNRCVNGDLPT